MEEVEDKLESLILEEAKEKEVSKAAVEKDVISSEVPSVTQPKND